MNSLQKRRLTLFATLGGAVALLIGMVAFNALRPADTEADLVREVSGRIIAVDFDTLSPAEREAMRRQWDELPEEVREQVFQEVARHRIDELRARTAELTPEERADHIRQARDRMREQRDKLTDEERVRIRERLNSPTGKRMVQRATEFYLHEFTPRERAEMEPLVREWFSQIDQLSR